ncbi:MAG: hypothetical protein EOP83_07900 [Verrucomicrobiaceae bacterium]|nr:MAG: hypothetical protein EOP83_07900 [Verrucomicrobiaceae bacterium]
MDYPKPKFTQIGPVSKAPFWHYRLNFDWELPDTVHQAQSDAVIKWCEAHLGEAEAGNWTASWDNTFFTFSSLANATAFKLRWM